MCLIDCSVVYVSEQVPVEVDPNAVVLTTRSLIESVEDGDVIRDSPLSVVNKIVGEGQRGTGSVHPHALYTQTMMSHGSLSLFV